MKMIISCFYDWTYLELNTIVDEFKKNVCIALKKNGNIEYLELRWLTIQDTSLYTSANAPWIRLEQNKWWRENQKMNNKAHVVRILKVSTIRYTTSWLAEVILFSIFMFLSATI